MTDILGPYTGYSPWTNLLNWLTSIISLSGTVQLGVSPTLLDNESSLNLTQLLFPTSGNATLTINGGLTLGGLTLGSGSDILNVSTLISGGAATASATINGVISNAGGGAPLLEASGLGATLTINAADPGGLDLVSAQNGLVELAGAVASTSILNFADNSGVFALLNPGGIIPALLAGVQIGDSIELPGLAVLSVAIGPNSIDIKTTSGDYTFANVSFNGTIPNDFTVSVDALTGLLKITLTDAPSFEANSLDTIAPYAGFYAWSNGANWSGGVPPTSGDVVIGGAGPYVDNETNLSLGNMNFTSAATLDVNGALTLTGLQFSAAGSLVADTADFPGGSSTAVVTVNGLTGSGFLSADGAGAILTLNAIDPGENFSAINGGELVLASALNAASSINVAANSVVTLGGVAATTAASITVAATGAIELPGSTLESSSFDSTTNTETIATNLGVYTFTDWQSGAGDFIASADASTGLLKLTREATGSANNPQVSQDFNGDGLSDIAFQDTSVDPGLPAVWIMNGSTISSSAYEPYPGSDWTLLASGDFNGDGKSDLVFENTAGRIAEWFMNGTSIESAGYLTQSDPGLRVEAAGDFNGDGRSDLALQNTDGSIQIWEMNGLNIIPNGSATIANPGTDWRAVATGDLNGDGKSELLFQRSADGALATWDVNQGVSGPTLDSADSVYLPNPGATWALEGVGDFNGDNKSDLVLQNNVNGAVEIWEMNGPNVLNSAIVGNPGTQWQIAAVGDYNGDGVSDILLRDSANGALAMWFMNGLSVQPSSTSLAAADIPGANWQVLG